MEDEIDLRPYFEAIIRNWLWIVGAVVLAAAVAYGVSSLLPPTYEATALVAITEARDVVQFDPRFSTVDEAHPLRAYPELKMVLINLKTGTVFRGLIWRRRGLWLVLREVELLSDRGNDLRQPRALTGETLVLLADVDFVQVVG